MSLRLIAAAVALAVGFSGPVPAAAADINWTMGSLVGANDDGTKMLEEYAKRVADRTKGRVNIKVVPVTNLNFAQADALRLMKQRAMPAMHIYPYMMARDEPRLTAFVPHGGLLRQEDNLKIADLQYDLSKGIYKEWGIEVVTRTGFALDPDTLLFVVSKNPMRTIDDLKKIKLRHAEPTGLAAWKSLGVSAQSSPPFSELYLALRTGVVDATVLSAQYIRSTSLFEVTKYMTPVMNITNASPNVIGIHESEWAKVPEDIKKILRDVGDEMYVESIAAWRLHKGETEAVKWLVSEGKMQELPSFPEGERRQIANALIQAWLDRCKELGNQVIEQCSQIAAQVKN